MRPMRLALPFVVVLLALAGCTDSKMRTPTPNVPSPTPAAGGDLPAWAAAFQDHVTIARDGDSITLASDSVPRHEYGPFPDMDDSNGDGRPDNPNTVREMPFSLRIPATPTPATSPGALGLGPIGIAISGVAIFDARNAEGRDAMQVEVFDACGGHPEMRGLYHYHASSPCVEASAPGAHDGVFGVAKDGYPIHGQQGLEGDLPTDLDACNGHDHGELGYHYHLTADAPYTLGCYHGMPL